MKINKKILAFVILPLFVMSMVAAAWVLYYQSTFTLSVSGGGNPINITQEFSNINIDTFESYQDVSNWLYFDSTKNTSIQINIEDDITDLTNGECDYLNDCNYKIDTIFNGIPQPGFIYDDDVVDIYEGSYIFMLHANCDQYSCETERDITLTLQEV